MSSELIRFGKCHTDAQLPIYRDEHSSCIIFYAPETIYLRYGSVKDYTLGVTIKELTPGYELQIHPLTDLAIKGVTILNSPLTVTSMSEIRIVITSMSLEPTYISRGDHVAIGVIRPVTRLTINPPKPISKDDHE
jgi:dUTP pyrophosphatase